MAGRGCTILLTGLPGCGKTTAVMRICAGLKDVRIAGFYTEEIRCGKARTGFRWKRFDGAEGILAGVDIKGRSRVGRYGVNVGGFEQEVVPVLDWRRGDVDLFVIDEIGKMECLSQQFVEAVRRLFAGKRCVLATVAQKGSGFVAEVKDMPGVMLLTLTERKRDSVADQIIKLLLPLKRTSAGGK
jgi:nucleoside-triphosphatase